MATVAYEKDYYAWTHEQANLLKLGKLNELDLQNLAEEISEMGRSVRNELFNRMVGLIMHLLKYQFQAERRSRSWLNSIKFQRSDLIELISENPSLKSKCLADEQWFLNVWTQAVYQAVKETNLNDEVFPDMPIWTIEQILETDFLPD